MTAMPPCGCLVGVQPTVLNGEGAKTLVLLLASRNPDAPPPTLLAISSCSCLVEVQPTVLDVRWLQAKVDSRLQSSSSSSSSSSSDDDDDDDDDDEQQDPSQPTSREGKQEAGMQVSSSIQRDGTHHDQQQQHHHHHHQCGRRSQELGSVSTVERIDASVPGSSASVVCLSSRSLYQGAAITLLLGIKVGLGRRCCHHDATGHQGRRHRGEEPAMWHSPSWVVPGVEHSSATIMGHQKQLEWAFTQNSLRQPQDGGWSVLARLAQA
eukprot:scaffold16579_cov20-Tisochrysis_lutea.AAC.2